MVKEFLALLSAIIKNMINHPEYMDEDIIKALHKCYQQMDEKEQDQALKMLLQYTDYDMQLYIFLLSFLLEELKDEKIVILIEELLFSVPMKILDRVNYLFQLSSFSFRNQIAMDPLGRYQKANELHRMNVMEANRLIGEEIPYIPYRNRKKNRIVFMIEPMLSELHGPTRKMLDFYYYFKKLGYEIYIYASNYRFAQIARTAHWWDEKVTTIKNEENGEFVIDYDKLNLRVQGYQILFFDDNFVNEMKKALQWIAEYQPLFVLSIGESNILADLCGQFTTVVSMSCTKKPPITTSNIIARYFFYEEEEEKTYRAFLGKGQKILDIVCMEFKEQEMETHPYTKRKFGIREEEFAIIIAGNRLDEEITNEVKRILFQILDENPSVCIVVIGDCPKMKEEIERSIYIDRFLFLGFVIDFKEIIGIGDLFLNPPRQGGGSGGAYAIYNHVPVVTLGNCDVSNVGEEFVCDSLEEMPQLVHRYVTDPAFMEEKREACRIKSKEWDDVDNLENIRKFCRELEEYVLEWEEAQHNISVEK